MAGQLFLGIEGGATRTTGVVTDGELRVLSRHVTGPTNLYAVGEKRALAAIHDILTHTLFPAGARVDTLAAMAFCIAGVRTEADQKVWRRLIRRKTNLKAPAIITHDAAAGLAAGSPEETGILVVCGTGSLVYARRTDGAERFVGGRGPILGDEGSGFDIGHRALRAALRASDGRGRPTLLERLIPERLGLGGLDDLVPWVSPFAKDRVASVAKIVFEAAESGDEVAVEILEGAAEELARAVGVAARELWPPTGEAGRPERVVFAGGVLRHQGHFRTVVTARIVERVAGVRCALPEMEGAIGAARIARRAASGQ